MANKIFTNLDHFYSEVKKEAFLSESFSSFVSSYENSIGGCKCSLAARRKIALNNYLNVDEVFSQEILDFMKNLYSAEKIIFSHEDQVFMEVA